MQRRDARSQRRRPLATAIRSPTSTATDSAPSRSAIAAALARSSRRRGTGFASTSAKTWPSSSPAVVAVALVIAITAKTTGPYTAMISARSQPWIVARSLPPMKSPISFGISTSAIESPSDG